MKKLNRIIAACVLVILLLLVIVPSVLKRKVATLMVEEIEANSDFQVKYESVDVSFFRNFPTVKVDVQSFLLESPTETVLDVENIKGELSFSKIMKNQLELKSAVLQYPKFNLTEEEKTEVLQPTVATSSPSEESRASSPFLSSFTVGNLCILDGQIHYQSMDSLSLILMGINLNLSGHLDMDEVLMKAQLSIDSIDYKMQGFSINDVPMSFDGEMLYTINSKLLSLKDNNLNVGEFSTSLLGDITVDATPEFDIDFDAPKTSIKSILALLPSSMIKDVGQLESSGDVSLNGFVKGEYLNAESWPAFGFDLSIADAWFKYQHLSEKVEQINMTAKILHPEATTVDNTVVSIDDLSLKSADNVLSTQLKITNPVSDITVSGALKSVLNLATLKNAIPMQASDVVGKVDADVSFDGKLADIEQERYQDFYAAGELTLKGFYLKNKVMPQGLSISSSAMEFTPERINIKSFKGKLGSSDLSLSGYLSDYFSYLFDDNTLNGKLKLYSKSINTEEFLQYDAQASSSTVSSASKKSTEEGAFLVPKKLNIVLNSSVDKVIVDDLVLQQLKGDITVKDAKVFLDGLNFNTLGGTVNVNGQYNSKNPKSVYSDMDLKIKNIDIAKATKSVSVIRKMLPITQTTQGKISTDMHYYAQLDAKGDLDPKTIKSNGVISSPGLRIANNSSLNSLAKQLNDPRYSDITTGAVVINYKMENGKITLVPFDVKMVDKNINAGGWYSLNNTLNFNIKTTVKAKEIGGDISKYIGMVSDVNKPLPVTIMLTGDAKKPTVKYDTREAIKVLRKDVSKNLNKDAINSILKSFF